MQPHLKNDLLYLLRIIEACEKIRLYANPFLTASDLFLAQEQMVFNACLNQLAQIGEQANKLSLIIQQNYPQIPWQQIRGFRNRVIHEYAGVDTELVFEIIQVQLPLLTAQLIPIIKTEIKAGNFDQQEMEVAKTSPYLSHVDFSKLSKDD
jgi:uncharacterized protein with HEPN domain